MCVLRQQQKICGKGTKGPLNEPLKDPVDCSSPKITNTICQTEFV